ncbi:MAG: carboxypeptidase regulatory-like domain-containing protein [Prevotella sp.]|nr:carboxypeptidase regulatory-like domain-containing protein [Prevotella sp.]
MKRTISQVLFLFAAILLGASSAVAQGYTVDFNTQIETNSAQTGTSNRDWKVAAGWGHIVDGVEYNYNGDLRYCPYEWQAEAGVDGTGAIYAGSQYYQDYYGDYESFYDLLVSPPIEGVVTIQAKRFNATGSIGFFKVTKNGDKLVRGDQVFPITQTNNAFTDLEEDWVTYTLPAQPAGTRIGIRLQQGWIDNFTAEGVDLTPQPGLGLTVVSPTVNTTVAANEDNTFEVSFEVQVKNTGDLDLTTATEGYNLELRKNVPGGSAQEDHTLIATANIPADLAVGETLAQNITLTATLSVDDNPTAATSGISFRVYENVSGSYASTRTITVIPYEPKFDMRQGYSALEDYATLSFGATQKPVSKEVIIRSLGGAPLVVESIDVPEGFSTTLAPKTIAPLTNDTITITLDATTPGHKEGAFVIHTNAGYKTLNLSGTVIGADDFFVDFSAASLEGIMLESSGSGYYTYGWTAPYTTYSITNEKARGYATSSSTPGPFKLILPKLKFEEGDVLQFDAQKASSYNDANLTIFYSADRSEWTRLRRLADDAERDADKLTTNEATYTLQNIPAGEWYIAFEITYESEVYLDNVIGGKPVEVKHDIVLNANVPEVGSVNKLFNAFATVRNLIATEEAGSYTAKLYFDDQVVKEVEPVTLTTGSDVNFSFAFTPHTAGTFEARIELAFADGEKVASTPVSVTIEEEVFAAQKQIGEGDKVTATSPLHGYYNKTKAENIYTAEELAAEGITAGAKISKIAFMGYNTSRDQDYPAKVWIAEQEADEFASTSDGSGIVEGTPVFDGTVTLLKDGSSSNFAQILTIDLPAQYTYQGGNLVIATQFDGTTYLGSSVVGWASSSTNGKTQALYNNNDNNLDGTYSASDLKPVVLLGIEAEPKTVSGKVTDKSTGAALADVNVTATSGEVIYSGKTNAEGNYEFAILQDGLSYQLSTDAEGYFPVNQTVSVKLESQVVNLQLVPARGVFIDKFEIAQTGMVNFPVNATVKASNYTADDIAAGAYTAKLYVAGEAVSEAEAVELKTGETKDFQFSFTPHAEGTFAAYVEFVEGENVTTSDEVEIVIGEELVGGDMQIGEATADRNYYSPINLYYNNSVADIVYTPEMLTAFGVLPGNQITSIKLTAQSESPKTFTATLSAWVGSINYDADAFVPGAGREELLQVKADEQLPLDLTGASSTSPIVWDITFDFTDNPIVFDGTNSVRLMVDKFADNFVGYTYFSQDKNYTTAWVQYKDGADQRESMWANLSSSASSYHSVPVATFSVAGGVTVSGTVTDQNGQPVAGAAVVAKSGDVIYEATTDETGAYTLDVKQASLEYTITVTAEGYKEATAEVAPNNADAEQDFVLEADLSTGISSLSAERLSGAVYNLEGKRVDGNRKGLYINGGKKVVVK